jgi:hypothetical protein
VWRIRGIHGDTRPARERTAGVVVVMLPVHIYIRVVGCSRGRAGSRGRKDAVSRISALLDRRPSLSGKSKGKRRRAGHRRQGKWRPQCAVQVEFR